MTTNLEPITILIADDDPDDRLLVEDAFEEVQLENAFAFVEDGEQLMDYLHQRGAYRELAGSPPPGLILLDLNMPKKDGRQALREIKEDPDLRSIPVVILTTSQAEEDILRSYNLGANSFIVKPVTFDKLVDIIHKVTNYWFQIVRRPGDAR